LIVLNFVSEMIP